MLKLTVYKKKFTITLVGGTTEPIILDHNDTVNESLWISLNNRLTYTMSPLYWEQHGYDFIHKGVVHHATDSVNMCKQLSEIIQQKIKVNA